MQEGLKLLFLQICDALGMLENDPLMHAWVADNINQMHNDFVVRLEDTLKNDSEPLNEWLENFEIQAIHIFSKLLEALSVTSNLKKNFRISLGSDKSKAIIKSTKTLIDYARTLKNCHGNISTDKLTVLIKGYRVEEIDLINKLDAGGLIDLIWKKNCAVVNAEARKSSDSIFEIHRITKSELAELEIFFMSVNTDNVFGYSSVFLEKIKRNVSSSTGLIISDELQKNFFKVLKSRMSVSEKIDKCHRLQYLMNSLDIKDLDALLSEADKKDSLVKKILFKINERPKLNDSEKHELASDPVLLFNVLMKLVTDNLIDGFSLSRFDGGNEKKHFSKNGLIFAREKLDAMYLSILKILDYKLHVTNKQYLEIKQSKCNIKTYTHKTHANIIFSANTNKCASNNLSKSETEANINYNDALQVLADYADLVQSAANEVLEIKLRNSNKQDRLLKCIEELKNFSRQLRAVKIDANAKVSKSMARTLISFTEKVITMSLYVEDEVYSVAPSRSKEYSAEKNRYINRIINLILRLLDSLKYIFGFKTAVVQPDSIVNIKNMKLKVVHKVQKIA